VSSKSAQAIVGDDKEVVKSFETPTNSALRKS
jgi:hypothetical protein